MYISAVTNQASFQKAEILLFKTLGKSECLGEKFKLTRYILRNFIIKGVACQQPDCKPILHYKLPLPALREKSSTFFS